MTPERWQQIDQLFHAALGYEPAQRPGFLVSECGGDEELRLEVERIVFGIGGDVLQHLFEAVDYREAGRDLAALGAARGRVVRPI